MGIRKSKIPLDILEEFSEEEIKERVSILRGILRNYQQWGVYVQEEGLYSLKVGRYEVHYYDILDGIDLLPKRQKESVVLLCLHDMKEVEAAKAMGFKRLDTPVFQYRDLALRKLVAFQILQERGRVKDGVVIYPEEEESENKG